MTETAKTGLKSAARTAVSAYTTVTRQIGIGLLVTAIVVAASAAIAIPLWLVATKMRSLYNIIFLAIFMAGIAWMIVRRIRSQAKQTGLQKALIKFCLSTGRLLGWVTALAAAPLFALALFSTGAVLSGIGLLIADLGAIGFLLISGRRNSANQHSL